MLLWMMLSINSNKICLALFSGHNFVTSFVINDCGSTSLRLGFRVHSTLNCRKKTFSSLLNQDE